MKQADLTVYRDTAPRLGGTALCQRLISSWGSQRERRTPTLHPLQVVKHGRYPPGRKLSGWWQSSLGKVLGELPPGRQQRSPAAAVKKPRMLTSSLWLSSRCCHPGSSHRDCPQGRSTRERWPHRWGTRRSPAPRRPPGKRPAGGGSRCAPAPPEPRHTARPGWSRGTHLELDPGKEPSEQQRTALKNPILQCSLVTLLFCCVLFPILGVIRTLLLTQLMAGQQACS